MDTTGTNTIPSIIHQLILIHNSNAVRVMSRKYQSIIVSIPGLKVKGDDTSSKMSNMIAEVANAQAKQGWKLISITPALVRDGALQKVIITMEKN